MAAPATGTPGLQSETDVDGREGEAKGWKAGPPGGVLCAARRGCKYCSRALIGCIMRRTHPPAGAALTDPALPPCSLATHALGL